MATLKYAKPQTFIGDPNDYRPWIVAVNLYLTSYAVTDDTQKINFCLGTMSGSAGDWKQDYIANRPANDTWILFEAALEQAFCSVQQTYEAEQKLRAYRQNGRYIEEYISGFAVLMSQAGLQDTVSTRAYFQEGLDPLVRHEALRANPDTLQLWKTAARSAYRIVSEQRRYARSQKTTQRSYRSGKPRQNTRNNRSYRPNPRYSNILREPVTHGRRNEWDMEIDYVQHMLNELQVDDEEEDEDLHEVYDSEEDLNNHEGSDSEDDTINYTGQGSANRGTAKSTLEHILNNVLTDEQRAALKKGECFFCKKKGHFYRDCEARKVYLNKSRTRNVPKRNSRQSSGPQRKGKGKPFT